MAKLGDFIGALLADAVQARVRADLEALKIAEAYSSHELLRHLPVPRFRLPDISVDFPVVVDELADEGQATQMFAPPARSELTTVVRRALITTGIKLNPKEREQVYRAAFKKSEQLLEAGPQALLTSGAVAKAVADSAMAVARRALASRTPEAPDLAPLSSTIAAEVRTMLTKRLAKSPHLRVNVASSAIKSHADNDSVLRVRLTISEDAYELVQDEDAGVRLTPE